MHLETLGTVICCILRFKDDVLVVTVHALTGKVEVLTAEKLALEEAVKQSNAKIEGLKAGTQRHEPIICSEGRCIYPARRGRIARWQTCFARLHSSYMDTVLCTDTY